MSITVETLMECKTNMEYTKKLYQERSNHYYDMVNMAPAEVRNEFYSQQAEKENRYGR